MVKLERYQHALKTLSEKEILLQATPNIVFDIQQIQRRDFTWQQNMAPIFTCTNVHHISRCAYFI
jgi:hypothetical protein